MKVAVSIPDAIFAEADALAARLKLPRSKVYARALGEFVASHSADAVTEAINAAVDAAGSASDAFARRAARRALAQTDW